MYKVLINILLSISVLFAEGLKSPSEFLGYDLGENFTYHHRVVSYFEHVAESVTHVKIEHYGKTYEQRPLIVAIVSSPENMANLERIRNDNLKRAGLLDGKPSGENVGIVWLSYNVHGNEANSTEASMKTLYTLADRLNKEAQKWLENTVVILDPCINPDGRDRYANWFRMTRNRWPNVDPIAREHMEPWPGGRTNHYYFDLNRDWAWQTQTESESRIQLYNQWLPHVHVDFHEQSPNSPYYFAPAAEPFHEYITDWQRELQTMIGKNHAKYFDENNWLYFTKEVFDLLYPSYGDTYPTYNGAIGMTYEQAGGGGGAVAVELTDGDTLTLLDRLTHHHTTSLSTVEVASKNTDRMLEEFSRFFATGKDDPRGNYKAYIIPASNDGDKLSDLKLWLETNGITYGHAGGTRTYQGFHYQTGKTQSIKTKTDDLVISAHQPKSVLVQVLFEPNTILRDSLTYDITAWALPYVYGLEAYAVKNEIKPKAAKPKRVASKSFKEKPYAYLLPWEGIWDLKFLVYLFKHKVVVRVSQESFEIDGQSFDRGTLVITRNGNEDLGKDFDLIIENAANEFKRSMTTVTTGFVTKGKDFGSRSMRVAKAPKIGLLSGNDVRSSAFGEVWHYFERQIEYPITVLNSDYFNRIPKHDFDVLILPSGNYSNINQETLNELRHWVRSGGRLILMDSALDSFVDRKGYGLKSYANDDEKKASEKKQKARKLTERLKMYKDRQRDRLSDNAYGSIIKIKMDNSHPLAFGYNDEYFSLRLRNKRYTYLPRGWNVGITQDSTALVSGFVGYKAQENFRESMVFGVEEIGRGRVIYLSDNPLFRAFWYNGKLLFGNAVFIVGN